MNYEAIREACCEANKELPFSGLVDLTFGNVSVLDLDAGIFAIKPSGVSYSKLKPSNMVLVDLDGRIVEGDLKPSSDTSTHRHLYCAWGGKGIASIVHTHSRSAVAFAQAGEDLPCLGTTHCDYFNGSVPVTRQMTPQEVGGDYEWDTGKVIVERFAELDPNEIPAVLVKNHGPFAWGATASKAVENALALEIVADMALKTFQIDRTVHEAPIHIREKHFYRKHGATAYYGQS